MWDSRVSAAVLVVGVLVAAVGSASGLCVGSGLAQWHLLVVASVAVGVAAVALALAVAALVVGVAAVVAALEEVV